MSQEPRHERRKVMEFLIEESKQAGRRRDDFLPPRHSNVRSEVIGRVDDVTVTDKGLTVTAKLTKRVMEEVKKWGGL